MSNGLKVGLQTTIYSLNERGWPGRRNCQRTRDHRETVGWFLRLPKPAFQSPLSGARLVHGTGHAPVENAFLLIQGDKVSAVGPADSVKYPDDAQVALY